MIARIAFLLFLSVGCVCGTYRRGNMTTLSAKEGIILSGGDDSVNETSVEVFDPSTGLSCSFPAMPDGTSDHTMDNLLICGVFDYSHNATCLSFTSGQWINSHTMLQCRYGHSSWQTEQGLVLMGGGGSPLNSEIWDTAGEQGRPSFDMQYSTDAACSMPDLTSDSIIITGGVPSGSTVSRYGVLGWIEDLPSLVEGREQHGCGSFLRGDGTQVFLVAGGIGSNDITLSSTEILTMDSPGWILTTPLPRALEGVRGVTLGGILYLTGGEDGTETYRSEILAWLDDEQEWELTGKMLITRSFHAVSTILMDDQAMEYCS